MNLNTSLAYVALVGRSLGRIGPSIVDVVASPAAFFRKKRSLVIDFRTPFPVELAWLGHRTLASLARALEKTIRKRELVFAANERMALLCKQLGAAYVHVLPNYPTKSFEPDTEPNMWKLRNELAPNSQVVLFTGGVRLREIYGLDLLLESWKIVENLRPSPVLVILGDREVDYIRTRMRLMGLHKILLPGRVALSDVANWIHCAEVCLAPRSPGFPEQLYDDKDSTKISEYASLKKPIVATRYGPSDQYELVAPDPDHFAEGIIKGLDGRIGRPKPHYWEENEPTMLKLLQGFWFR
jgi:glycosyltransferase involved in cell wall biosynthesis